MSDHIIYRRFAIKAAWGVVGTLIALNFWLMMTAPTEPTCTLIDPADVEAGLDYSNNTWTWQDGTRFGFAPEEDSMITPADCYEEAR